MRAAVISAVGGPFEIEDLVIDEPLGREVRVTVRAVGLCHSDLTFAENDYGTPLPMVLGHEFAGVVDAVGPDVADVHVGDHVVGSLVRACGRCDDCVRGRPHLCARRNQLLRRRSDPPRLSRPDGTPVTAALGTSAFAEQTIVHENQLVVIPQEIAFAPAAVLGCATITGAGAVINTAKVQPGDAVAVIGLGGVGLNAISGASIAGASRVIAIDMSPDKLELARRFGATHTINAAEQDSVEAVRKLTGGGVEHAFEMVGNGTTTLQAVQMTRVGGAAYLVGMHRPGSVLDYVDVTNDLLGFQRSIVGVYMGSSNIRHDIPMFADLYLSGRLNLDDLITAELSLSQINDGFDTMRSGNAVRSVITSWD